VFCYDFRPHFPSILTSFTVDTFQASDEVCESFTMGSHAACYMPNLIDFAAGSSTDKISLNKNVKVGFLDQEGLDDQNKGDYLRRLVNTASKILKLSLTSSTPLKSLSLV
jgi:hypothetical protein